MSEQYMVKIETMGTKIDCAIVSIAIVEFRLEQNGESPLFLYRELDYLDQEGENFKVDVHTYEWWKTRPIEARKCLNGLDDLESVLREINHFIKNKKSPIWCNGINFDLQILTRAYHIFKMTPPWQHWRLYDLRTIKYLYEMKRGGLQHTIKRLDKSALDQAQFQVTELNTMLADLFQ